MYEDDDDGDEREEMLKMLRGEVSGFAGSQLEDPDKPKGVTITIAMEGKPAMKDMGKLDMPMDEDDGDKGQDGMDSDDHIAHILGMCGGGCAMCKGGMV